jgi:D-proline reductase (dithiol) PrdB
MARLADLPAATQKVLQDLECPAFSRQPFLAGPPLAQRRIALVTTAGLVRRGEKPFLAGDSDYRALPAAVSADELLMTHVSVNFDRTGFQRDRNVVFPLDRLRELAAAGTIGSVASTHYSFMGATDPKTMEIEARALARRLQGDRVTGAVLSPV